MTDPKKISIKNFTYILPEERIAKYPLTERDASRLLIYKGGVITEDIYKNISDHIPEKSLVVFNDTKVVEARLLFQKPSGGQIEVFCLEPHEQYTDITTGMMQQGTVLWQCLIGGASKWKHGQILEKKIHTSTSDITLLAKYIGKRADSFIIELSWQPESFSFAELLHHAGAIPLPPYLKRDAEAYDADRYQTIYAHAEGSVAAPTAGLHFTGFVFDQLKTRNIDVAFVTLHVGAGTFKPVKAETMSEHEMHTEFIQVSRQTIQQLLDKADTVIIAAGTTSLRAMESLYWLGVKLTTRNDRDSQELWRADHAHIIPSVGQWETYERQERDVPAKEALQAVLSWMNKNKMEQLIAKTKIIIAPGYTAKIAKALITNFHQPQSTLLLLVDACMGDDWKKIYDYALQNNFRFLSYGDGSLLWFNTPGA